MKKTLIFLLISCISSATIAQVKNIEPIPALKPNADQQKMIDRKYGMFIHFGINTFCDQEWTDGSVPASKYNPPTIDAEQWVKTAKDAGMKYIILITKHHDGFCMWDSKLTTYDVASSGNKTNVVEAVAKACKKYNIGLGLYYSLWDRKENANVKNSGLDAAYNQYMLAQLNELITIATKHTPIVEFWFDGGWEKPNNRWPIQDIYNTIKARQPHCQVGINWTIGLPENPDYHLVHGNEQKEGYPMRYFPSDFRLGDPDLPGFPDPKTFTHNNKKYYLPWETTVCMSKRWFYNSKDSTYKSVYELYDLYKTSTAQNNILILNCPPNTQGKMRDRDIALLADLKKMIDQPQTSVFPINKIEIPNEIRAKQISDTKFGMFICWSFSTLSGHEWTPTKGKTAKYFNVTGCNTDQWCKTAKDAGMNYILFLTKHHDGFCLWDTKTTDLKVTNSPLGYDVLKKLKESCDKYGLKLALYFSEGDWNFPGAVDLKNGGINPEKKKAQLKELLTNYGDIEYIWFDHAQGDGGLSHAETDKFVYSLQPNCLPGYNHGENAGKIRLGEMGHATALGDSSGAGYNKTAHLYKKYIAAEFTYPILPAHKGGAMWFYSLPEHDNLVLPAEKLYKDYVDAVKFKNIFSIDIGPNPAGNIRDIDVKTLKEVGDMIKKH